MNNHNHPSHVDVDELRRYAEELRVQTVRGWFSNLRARYGKAK